MLGTRTFQRPDEPVAPTSMAPRRGSHLWAMSWAWRRQKSFITRLRSAARTARYWRMSCLRAAACLSVPPVAGPVWLGGTRAMHP